MHKPHPAACHALKVLLVKASVLPRESTPTQHILPANTENCCKGPCLMISSINLVFIDLSSWDQRMSDYHLTLPQTDTFRGSKLVILTTKFL